VEARANSKETMQTGGKGSCAEHEFGGAAG